MNVNDVWVIENADDVTNGVTFANVREELVAKAFAFAGAFDEAGDVDEFDGGWNDFFGIYGFGKLFEAMVRYFNDADVGVDGAERIILGISAFCPS